MSTYVVKGTVRVVIEADSAGEAENILADVLGIIDCSEYSICLEEITISDAVEVEE